MTYEIISARIEYLSDSLEVEYVDGGKGYAELFSAENGLVEIDCSLVYDDLDEHGKKIVDRELDRYNKELNSLNQAICEQKALDWIHKNITNSINYNFDTKALVKSLVLLLNS